MEKFDRNGVTLTSRRAGTIGKPPLVLLHGLSVSSATYVELAEEIADLADIFMLDFCGHGGSDRAPARYTSESHASEVAAFIESVVARPAYVAGHSMGGVVAFQLTAARPDLVLALLLLRRQASKASSTRWTVPMTGPSTWYRCPGSNRDLISLISQPTSGSEDGVGGV